MISLFRSRRNAAAVPVAAAKAGSDLVWIHA